MITGENMVHEDITRDYLRKHGAMTSFIVVKRRENVTDVFLEDETRNRKQIAKDVNLVNVEGIAKDNKVYHIMTVKEGYFYVADYILHKELVDKQFKTLTLLIPIYWYEYRGK